MIISDDGSHTIEIPDSGITYHSRRGAVQESLHVFIEAGLNYVLNRTGQPQTLHIFEMGFGTGLNAFLTAIPTTEAGIPIHYTAVETHPLSLEEVALLNYSETLGHKELFQKLHEAYWNDAVHINDFFTLEKRRTTLAEFDTDQKFDLFYFDAFAPSAQPELWTKEIFEKLFYQMAPGGVLVTYCSKGDARRAMIAAGFTVKKLPGPPGKREMLRAEKTSA